MTSHSKGIGIKEKTGRHSEEQARIEKRRTNDYIVRAMGRISGNITINEVGRYLRDEL